MIFVILFVLLFIFLDMIYKINRIFTLFFILFILLSCLCFFLISWPGFAGSMRACAPRRVGNSNCRGDPAGRPTPLITSQDQRLLKLFKLILGSAALRADPVVRDFVKRRSRSNSVVWIAYLWIVNISAYQAFVFIHVCTLLSWGMAAIALIFGSNCEPDRAF